MDFQAIFDSLDNGSRTLNNPALDWMAVAIDQGWDKSTAAAYCTYSGERIYSNADHDTAMAVVERTHK